MKVFIIFLSLLIINMGLVTYQDDHTMFERIEYDIKSAAEDCAYGCAMFYDDEAYSEGYLSYDTEDAVRYIDTVLKRRTADGENSLLRELHYKAYFFDESGMCRIIEDGSVSEAFEVKYPYVITDDEGYQETVDEPMVKVVITAETYDIFRQDFLYSDRVVRSASYSNKPISSM